MKVTLPGLLGVVFITLKLCGVINWSWWFVLMPFWFWLAIVGVLFLFAGLMFAAAGVLAVISGGEK